MEQEAGDGRVLMSSPPKLVCKDTGSSQSASKHSSVELRCGRFGSRPRSSSGSAQIHFQFCTGLALKITVIAGKGERSQH